MIGRLESFSLIEDLTLGTAAAGGTAPTPIAVPVTEILHYKPVAEGDEHRPSGRISRNSTCVASGVSENVGVDAGAPARSGRPQLPPAEHFCGVHMRFGAFPANPIDVQLHQVIGRGSFGAVYRGTAKRYQNCAIKISRGKLGRLRDEIAVMRRLSEGGVGNKHVIRLYFAALALMASPSLSPSGPSPTTLATRANSTGTDGPSSQNDILSPVLQAIRADTAFPEVKDAGATARSLDTSWSEEVAKLSAVCVIGMELCVPLTLHDFLLEHQLASYAEFQAVAHQVIEAVQYAHSKQCAHRDLKLQNFVFGLDCSLKLIDFGLAVPCLSPPSGDVVAGTVSFMAPEMAHNVLHKDQRVSVGSAADVWSLGIILFSVLTRRSPYPELSRQKCTTEQLLPRVCDAQWAWPRHSEIVGGPHGGAALLKMIDCAKPMIEAMLQKDPAKRPSLETVLNTRWYWLNFDPKSTPTPQALKEFLPSPAPETSQSALPGGVENDARVPVNMQAAKESLAAATSVSSGSVSAGHVSTEGRSVSEENNRKEHDSTGGAVHGSGGAGGSVHYGAFPAFPLSGAFMLPQGNAATSPMDNETRVKKEEEKEVIVIDDDTQSEAQHQEEGEGDEAPPLTEAPTFTRKELFMAERKNRTILQKMLTAELEAVQGYVRLEEEQDVEWYMLTWRAENEAKYARCTHTLKAVTSMPKGYDSGFMCDRCGSETWPSNKQVKFFHCRCGMDLCVECEDEDRARRTCTCGKVLPNLSLLTKHQQSKACRAVLVPKEMPKNFTRKRGRVDSDAKEEKATTAAVVTPHHEGEDQLGAGVASKKKNQKGKNPTASSAEEGKKQRPSGRRKKDETHSTDAEERATQEGEEGEVEGNTERRVEQHDLAGILARTWAPFERFLVGNGGMAANGTCLGADPDPVTPEEHALLFQTHWVKYYHYAYERPEDRVQGGQGNPLSLCYEIQPGRIGAVFLHHGFSIAHSAVLVSFPIPPRLFVVHELDIQGAEDRTMLVEFDEAKLEFPGELQLLKRTATENASLLKCNRAPGPMTVHRSSVARTGFGCTDSEIIYVRWIKGDPSTGLVIFTLSNGGVQVFGEGFELRWFDEERKFLIRSDGTCALVNDATFVAMPAIEQLLREPLFSVED